MKYTVGSWLVLASYISSTLAAPAVGDFKKRQTLVTQLPTGPVPGDPRGPTSLNGFNNVAATQTPIVEPIDFTLAPGQSDDADLGVYIDGDEAENLQPIRGQPDQIPTDPGPRNMLYEKINTDLYAPPGTDAGGLPNAVWPLGLSHNRHGLNSSGWARQQNTQQLPIATAMAGVDMRLEPFAYRELHWHNEDEWAYILNGSVRISSVNEAGETMVDDLIEGDLWFFPAGVPHNIQAKEKGVEFLLIFDDGSFSEDSTFLVSELFERNPKSVLAKNFRTDPSAFDNLPDGELYIFPGTPMPANISEQNVTGPAGQIPRNATYSYHASQQEAYKVPGGSVKIFDSLSFPVASNFAAALFTIEPGAMREIHWHTKSDEWSYFIAGDARLTVYSAPDSSQTFDFHAGDVGYVPVPNAHYIENVGDTDVVYIEMLLSGAYNDISVNQWLGLTPRQVVKDHLHLPDSVLDNLPKVKPYIVPGHTDLLNTNYTGDSI